MISRILQNWETTVIGLGIIITCFVLVFIDKATLTEVGGFIAGGLFVLFSKDSMLKKKGPVCLVLLCCLLPVGCRPYQSFTKETDIILRDTIRTKDTIFIRMNIPGDTVYRERPRIIVDTVLIRELQNGTFTIAPWDASTKYAYAKAGITNGKPWLQLTQKPVDIDTTVYVDKIKILEQRLRDRNAQIVTKAPFYENTWFWIAVVLGLLLFIKSNYKKH